MKVVHFHRRARTHNFSIERLFASIRQAMPADVQCVLLVSPNFSQGLLPRLGNILTARRRRSEVNHITGDEHFLAFGLPRDSTILTVHDCGILHCRKGVRRALLRLFWFTLPIARCRIVTTVSEATRRELVRFAGADPAKIRVIHDCVGPEFIPQPGAFDGGTPRILLLGTAPNKNLERVAAALQGMPCAVELVGAASGAHKAAFADRGVRLTALGSVDDAAVLAAYGRCDLLLFASLHEGFGMPIIEAQAVGRPVVTSNCSSMPEVAGGSACLVDPLAPASIRAGVERVIRDREYRESLVAQGFKNVERFRAAAIAAQYAALYREIAAQRL